jgi:CBS domain-containing protein
MSFKSLRAEEIMTRDVITIDASASLRQAARVMNQHHIHCLIVPATDPARCVGVVTMKDVVQVLCEAEAEALDELRVVDVMSAPAFGLQKGFTVGDCIKLMRMTGVRSAPVLDGTRVVGLLSFTDVVRAAAQG